MKHVRRLENEKGFSLVGVMMLGTIGVIGSLALINLFVNQLKGIRTIETRSDAVSLARDIETALSNPHICPQLLLSAGTQRQGPQPARFNPDVVIPTTASFAMVRLSNYRDIVVGGKTSSSLFTSLSLRELDENYRQDLPLRKRYLVALSYELKAQGQVFGASERGKEFVLHVETDADPTNEIPDDQIVACYLKADDRTPVSVPGETAVGGLIRIDTVGNDLKQPGAMNGYNFTGGRSSSNGTYDPTEDVWRFTESRLYTSCSKLTPERWLGCHRIDYPSMTVNTPGSFITVQAYTGLWVSNDSNTDSFTVTASYEIACGTTVRKVKIASLGVMRSNMGLDGTSLPIQLPTTPGGTCRVTPFFGWSWWPSTGRVNANANASFSVYHSMVSISHYR